jgi:hypothetical protein
VIDATTSIGLPSGRKVVATFDNIKEASEFAKQTDEFKIRPQPMKRRKKDDPDDE